MPDENGQEAQVNSTPTDDTTSQALDNADRKDARTREQAAQENKSWLYRNINPVLALTVLGLSFIFFFFVLRFDFTSDPTKKDVVIYLLGSVSTLVTMVCGYYFGSSKGSSDKSKAIEKNLNH